MDKYLILKQLDQNKIYYQNKLRDSTVISVRRRKTTQTMLIRFYVFTSDRLLLMSVSILAELAESTPVQHDQVGPRGSPD